MANWASLVAQMVNFCLQCRWPGFDPWVGKIPWRRKWQPTPVFLPGKSHGLRILLGYSPWGRKSQTWLSDWASNIEEHPKIQLKSTLDFCISPSEFLIPKAQDTPQESVRKKKTIHLHYYNCVNAISIYKGWTELEKSKLGRVYLLALCNESLQDWVV